MWTSITNLEKIRYASSGKKRKISESDHASGAMVDASSSNTPQPPIARERDEEGTSQTPGGTSQTPQTPQTPGGTSQTPQTPQTPEGTSMDETMITSPQESSMMKRYEAWAKFPFYEIGVGTFGSVYRVEEKYAVKVLKEKIKKTHNYQMEKDVLELIKKKPHKNILKIYHNEDLSTVFEFLFCWRSNSITQKTMDLFTLIENTSLSNRVYFLIEKEILKQIYDGVIYLHSLNIVHRDLKPDNISIVGNLEENPTVKLIDFNLSCVLDETSGIFPMINTEQVLPPGLCGTQGYLSLISRDIFALQNKKVTVDEYEIMRSNYFVADYWAMLVTFHAAIFAEMVWSHPFDSVCKILCIANNPLFEHFVKTKEFVSTTKMKGLTALLHGYDISKDIATLMGLLYIGDDDTNLSITHSKLPSFHLMIMNFFVNIKKTVEEVVEAKNK